MWRGIIKYPNCVMISAVAATIGFMLLLYSLNPPIIYAVATEQKVIALTVDDGPDPKYSPQIVEILNKYGAKATFFVVGEQVEKFPDVLRLEIASGNEIGAHSYYHKNLALLRRSEVQREILATNGMISKHTGKTVRWFRPPYGQYNRMVLEEAKRHGLETVLWTSVVENKYITDPQKLAVRVIDQAEPGGIVLFHDSRLDRCATIAALPIIIEDLQKKGYRFVTLSELHEIRGTKI